MFNNIKLILEKFKIKYLVGALLPLFFISSVSALWIPQAEDEQAICFRSVPYDSITRFYQDSTALANTISDLSVLITPQHYNVNYIIDASTYDSSLNLTNGAPSEVRINDLHYREITQANLDNNFSSWAPYGGWKNAFLGSSGSIIISQKGSNYHLTNGGTNSTPRIRCYMNKSDAHGVNYPDPVSAVRDSSGNLTGYSPVDSFLLDLNTFEQTPIVASSSDSFEYEYNEPDYSIDPTQTIEKVNPILKNDFNASFSLQTFQNGLLTDVLSSNLSNYYEHFMYGLTANFDNITVIDSVELNKKYTPQCELPATYTTSTINDNFNRYDVEFDDSTENNIILNTAQNIRFELPYINESNLFFGERPVVKPDNCEVRISLKLNYQQEYTDGFRIESYEFDLKDFLLERSSDEQLTNLDNFYDSESNYSSKRRGIFAYDLKIKMPANTPDFIEKLVNGYDVPFLNINFGIIPVVEWLFRSIGYIYEYTIGQIPILSDILNLFEIEEGSTVDVPQNIYGIDMNLNDYFGETQVVQYNIYGFDQYLKFFFNLSFFWIMFKIFYKKHF